MLSLLTRVVTEKKASFFLFHRCMHSIIFVSVVTIIQGMLYQVGFCESPMRSFFTQYLFIWHIYQYQASNLTEERSYSTTL